MRGRITSLLESLGASYWFIPSLMAAFSAFLALFAIHLDQSGHTSFLSRSSLISFNEPSGARSLVSTIASSMITVAGTIFSITLAVLQLTSSQFGPRLLSNFMRDRGNQIVLGTFVSTYIYCLLVIRAIREGGEVGTSFVPHLSVLLALFFALASLGVFIFFIHHTASSIQAGTIVTRIAGDISGAIQKLFPEKGERVPPIPRPSGVTAIVETTKAGYLQGLDERALLTFAVKQEAVLEVLPAFGTFLLPGQPLVRVYLNEELTGESLEERTVLFRSLEGQFTLGPRRSGVRDLDFLFAQLTEMALRALSPSMNDAVTAMRCTDRIAQGLLELEGRNLSGMREKDGQLRLLLPELDTAQIVHQSLGELRRFSADNLLYSRHLLATYGKLLSLVESASLKQAIHEEAKRVLEGAEAELLPKDFRELESCYRDAIQTTTLTLGAPTLQS